MFFTRSRKARSKTSPHSLILMLLVLGGGNALGQNPYNGITVQFASSSYSVNENGGTAILTVTLSSSTTQTVTVNYATSDGTAVSGTDYVAASGTVTFNPGVTSQTISVDILDNGSDTDQSVCFSVALSQPSSNVTLGTPSTTTVNILDNDLAPPTVQFSSASYSVSENAGEATITVTLSAASLEQVTVDYATSDGTATSPNEYLPANGTLVFPPGSTSQTFNVQIVDDGIYEPNDTIELTLSNPTIALLGLIDDAEITILDTDGPPPGSPTVQFSSDSYTVSDTAGVATITVTLSAAATSTITVNYATSDDTAIAPDDYQSASGTLTFAPGETSQSFNVTIVDNPVYESDRTVDLALCNPTNAGLGDPSTATLDITQSAPPPNTPTVQFSSATYSVNENAGSATITVNLSAASTQTVTVNYETSDGTATAPNEYQPASGTLTFSPGTTSQSFNVVIVDGVYDPNNTINLNLSDPINATLGDTYSAVLTILDDSSPPSLPTVQFSQSSYTINEFGGTATITVNLSASYYQVVSVAYSTSDGTAQAPTNYVPASGVLTFCPGDTSQSFTVEILDDPGVTSNLYLNLALSSPTNATLGSPVAAILNLAPAPEPPFSVYIKRRVNGAGPIAPISAANNNQNVLPGQKMDLYTSIIGPVGGFPPGTTFTYSWTLPGVVFYDYTANQKKGILTSMTDQPGYLTGQSVQFYWADTGDGRVVTCTVTASNGMQSQGTATLNVKAPTVAGFTATIGTVQASADGARVGLFAAGGAPPGINFGNVTVSVPAGFDPGKWNYVQRIKPGVFRTLGDGTRQQANTNGQWVLDISYPYDPAPIGSYPVGSPIAGSYATGNTPRDTVDSPDVSLALALKDTGMKNQQWEMYVMFLPPGVDSRYVPLQKIAWNVNFTVKNLGAGRMGIFGASQNAGNATVASIHPQWNANVKPFTQSSIDKDTIMPPQVSRPLG